MKGRSLVMRWRRPWGAPQAGALAGALLVAIAGAAARAEAPSPAPPAPAPEISVPAAPDAAGKTLKAPLRPVPCADVFGLPPNYRNTDGSVNQEAIIAQQKKRLETINEKLRSRLRVTETPHYLLFSDADAAMTGQFAAWSEALYANLCTQFGIERGERVWDGKCILLLFAKRATFAAFAGAFDSSDVNDAGAYFAWECYPLDEPQLVHICIPTDERAARRLKELFAHEGTHAFFQLYRRPVDLPLWLHEGLAEYMTVVNDPALAPQKTLGAVALARLETPAAKVLGSAVGQDFSLQEYSVAYTMVDCLLKAGRGKFKAFVLMLKEGKDQESALQAAYGFGLAELQARWRASLAAPPAPPAEPPRKRR